MDVASSHFYKEGRYHLGGRRLESNEMIACLAEWVERYPIVSVEDGLAEDDWDHWPKLVDALGGRCLVLGDDLLCTNPSRIRLALETKAATAVLVKVNQVGTLTETMEAIELAKRAGYGTVISHRSGETEDTFVADLAVAVNAGQIKTGSVARSERTAKYNQLLRIEEELGNAAAWPGRSLYSRTAR